MKKSIITKLLIICFIGVLYLPFFNVSIKASSSEPEICVEGVSEGGTFSSPNIKFYLINKKTISTFTLVTKSGIIIKYTAEGNPKISLLLDEDGNLISDNPFIIINDLNGFSFNEEGIIVNDKEFSVNNGIVSTNGYIFDYSNMFDSTINENSLLIKVINDFYYINDYNTGITTSEGIKSFGLESTESTKIVSSTLNGVDFQTNTTLKTGMFDNGDYELKIVDSLGNEKIINFTLYNKPYLLDILEVLLKGTCNSLIIFVITFLFGIPLGIVGCVLKKVSIKPFGSIKSENKIIIFIKNFNPLKSLLDLYTWVIRGTPLLLQLFVVYFGLPLVFGKDFALKPLQAACITFVINYAAYFIEIFRGGMESINKGQFSSCYVLGMTKMQTYMKIIIPQTVKKALPSITNEAITLVKDTALASVVTVHDILFYTEQRVSLDFRLDAYFIAAIIYLVFSFVIVFVFTKIEKKYSFYN